MNEQSNTYRVYDSMGRATDVVYCASNMKQAYALFKADVKNSDYPFMHLLYSQLLVCQRVCLQNTVCLICK